MKFTTHSLEPNQRGILLCRVYPPRNEETTVTSFETVGGKGCQLIDNESCKWNIPRGFAKQAATTLSTRFRSERGSRVLCQATTHAFISSGALSPIAVEPTESGSFTLLLLPTRGQLLQTRLPVSVGQFTETQVCNFEEQPHAVAVSRV